MLKKYREGAGVIVLKLTEAGVFKTHSVYILSHLHFNRRFDALPKKIGVEKCFS